MGKHMETYGYIWKHGQASCRIERHRISDRMPQQTRDIVRLNAKVVKKSISAERSQLNAGLFHTQSGQGTHVEPECTKGLISYH